MIQAFRIPLLFFTLAYACGAHAQNVSLQFIHGSADPAVEKVDIWMDSVQIIDDLSFRSASGLSTFPSSGPLQLYVTDSSGIDTLLVYTDSLLGTGNHVLTLCGLVDSLAGYSHFEELQLTRLETDLTSAQSTGNTDLIFVQGATDLENTTVSEIREELGELLNGLSFGQYSSRIELYTSRFRFSTSASGKVISQVEADLIGAGLEDSVALVLISGFRSPENNLDGPALNLQLVQRNGSIVPLPVSTGHVQFIHNASDPNLSALDVFFKDERVLNDLSFRAASGYLSLPSGVSLPIAITRDSATGIQDPLISDSIFLDAEQSYVCVLTGLITPNLNPFEPFEMHLKPSRREALNPGQTDVLFHQGGQGLPSASIYESSILNTYLVKNLPFGAFTVYRSLPYSDFVIDLIDETDGSISSTYDLNLTQFNLQGEAITMVSSGWKDTNSAEELAPLGLWMARSFSGKLIELPLRVGVDETGKEQVKIFPNPATTTLHLRSPKSIGDVAIRGVSGQLVYEASFRSTFAHIDLSAFSSGIYLVELRDGSSLHRQHLVIQ
ncbi:MAG: T9SS type A sorting domain-containing protein [Flavobacteriales bacterium]|nr:T9SS type A sorting domain-containing protein [Flavobacteriales bacterium]